MIEMRYYLKNGTDMVLNNGVRHLAIASSRSYKHGI